MTVRDLFARVNPAVWYLLAVGVVGVVFAATPAFPWLNARVVAPILTFLFDLV